MVQEWLAAEVSGCLSGSAAALLAVALGARAAWAGARAVARRCGFVLVMPVSRRSASCPSMDWRRLVGLAGAPMCVAPVPQEAGWGWRV
jgi:hypothetical protein